MQGVDALHIRIASIVAAVFADAGVTAIVTDEIIGEGFESPRFQAAGRATS